MIATNDVYDSSALALTNAAQAVLISVEYRKAPEYRFPTAHEDAYAAYVWALEHAQDINGDPGRVAVAGESAWGNLAAGVAMMAKERGQKLPAHQLLVYPVAGYDFTTPSYRQNAHALPLNKAMMPWFFEKYLMPPPTQSGRGSRLSRPRISKASHPPRSLRRKSIRCARRDSNTQNG